jgi:hypothetical protein
MLSQQASVNDSKKLSVITSRKSIILSRINKINFAASPSDYPTTSPLLQNFPKLASNLSLEKGSSSTSTYYSSTSAGHRRRKRHKKKSSKHRHRKHYSSSTSSSRSTSSERRKRPLTRIEAAPAKKIDAATDTNVCDASMITSPYNSQGSLSKSLILPPAVESSQTNLRSNASSLADLTAGVRFDQNLNQQRKMPATFQSRIPNFNSNNSNKPTQIPSYSSKFQAGLGTGGASNPQNTLNNNAAPPKQHPLMASASSHPADFHKAMGSSSNISNDSNQQNNGLVRDFFGANRNNRGQRKPEEPSLQKMFELAKRRKEEILGSLNGLNQQSNNYNNPGSNTRGLDPINKNERYDWNAESTEPSQPSRRYNNTRNSYYSDENDMYSSGKESVERPIRQEDSSKKKNNNTKVYVSVELPKELMLGGAMNNYNNNRMGMPGGMPMGPNSGGFNEIQNAPYQQQQQPYGNPQQQRIGYSNNDGYNNGYNNNNNNNQTMGRNGYGRPVNNNSNNVYNANQAPLPSLTQRPNNNNNYDSTLPTKYAPIIPIQSKIQSLSDQDDQSSSRRVSVPSNRESSVSANKGPTPVQSASIVASKSNMKQVPSIPTVQGSQRDIPLKSPAASSTQHSSSESSQAPLKGSTAALSSKPPGLGSISQFFKRKPAQQQSSSSDQEAGVMSYNGDEESGTDAGLPAGAATKFGRRPLPLGLIPEKTGKSGSEPDSTGMVSIKRSSIRGSNNLLQNVISFFGGNNLLIEIRFMFRTWEANIALIHPSRL